MEEILDLLGLDSIWEDSEDLSVFIKDILGDNLAQ